MVSFKNIRIKKRGGGTRTQRVQVLSSGKYKFVKNKSSRSSNPRPKKARKVKRKMARRRYYRTRSRKKKSMTIPLAPVMGVLAGALRTAPSGSNIVENIMTGDFAGLAYNARELFAGIDNTGAFRPEWLLQTYGPMAVGALIHKFVGGSPLNLNRMLAAAGVPFIRI